MHLEKFWLDQIQNGPLSAIIYFHMHNILHTVLDVSPFTIKQNLRFRGRMHPNFLTSLYRIENDRKPAISYLGWPDIG